MKKNLSIGMPLTKRQMKRIKGGLATPCVSCSRICHVLYTDATETTMDHYDFGNCNQVGHPGAVCDNYCCAPGQSTYWC